MRGLPGKLKYDFFTYVFVPFRLRSGNSDTFCEALVSQPSCQWRINDKIPGYLFRFVTNKIQGKNSSCCVHFVLDPDADVFKPKYQRVSRHPETVDVDPLGRYTIRLLGMELFCFSTNVCLLAVKVGFDSSDPDYLINGCYRLKFVEKTRYRTESAKEERTLLDLVKMQIEGTEAVCRPEFFYYTGNQDKSLNQNTAFLFSFWYLAQPRDFDEDMHYLCNAMGRRFHLVCTPQQLEAEKFQIVKHVCWGVTGQAAVCIAQHIDGENFVENTLPGNIDTNYLFMFVYLLHQKYTLYHFMMQIDTELHHNINKLEQYQEELIRFKKDFVYARISETPQYQLLYQKCVTAFALEEMYEDVEEPLSMIDDMETKRREKSDDFKNILLAALGLLGLYSAIVDGDAFGDMLVTLFDKPDRIPQMLMTHLPHVVLFVLIAALLVYIVWSFIRNRKRSEHD